MIICSQVYKACPMSHLLIAFIFYQISPKFNLYLMTSKTRYSMFAINHINENVYENTIAWLKIGTKNIGLNKTLKLWSKRRTLYKKIFMSTALIYLMHNWSYFKIQPYIHIVIRKRTRICMIYRNILSIC